MVFDFFPSFCVIRKEEDSGKNKIISASYIEMFYMYNTYVDKLLSQLGSS